MSGATVKGGKGSRVPVDLFGAVDEALEMLGDDPSPVVRYALPNLLKSAAGRAIFCPVTDEVLDYRSCVVITCEGNGNSVVSVVSPAGWADAGPSLVERVQGETVGGVVKVLTLRHVNARLRAAGLGVAR